MKIALPQEGQHYQQTADVGNPDYRDVWVREILRRISGESENHLTVLDVGAGEGPYRSEILDLGFQYRGHDFAEYIPEVDGPGMQNKRWDYTQLDFTCDIMDIPSSAQSDIVLCTEVLEHVPNPADAFRKMVGLVNPGGWLLCTVPFLSLMHQAPHWYSSGLSPFWFHHHASQAGLTECEIEVHGDYFDLMNQEIRRLLRGTSFFHRTLTSPLIFPTKILLGLARRLSPESVRQIGGLGVTFLGRRGPL